MIPIAYNVRSLFVRKTTTIATIFGVALVVFVLASSQMLSNGIKKTMQSSGSPSNLIVLRQGADAELSSTVESRLVSVVKAVPGVKKGANGAPVGVGEVVLVLALELAGTAGQVTNIIVRGVPDDVYALRPDVTIVQGRPAKPGTNEVVVGQRLLGRFKGVTLGGTFDLNKNRPAVVVGVMESGGSSFESEIWTDVDTLRSAVGRDALVSSITVALDSPSAYDAAKATIESDKQLQLQVMRESEYYEKQSEGTSEFIGIMGGAIVFFFSFGAMIGAAITMYAAVANRSREIGTLRALGFSGFQVLTSFLLEAVILALLGGALGAALSLLMSTVRFSMMNFATWSEVTFSFVPTPQILVSALLMGGLMGVVGGIFPAVRAARTSPLIAMRE